MAGDDNCKDSSHSLNLQLRNNLPSFLRQGCCAVWTIPKTSFLPCLLLCRSNILLTFFTPYLAHLPISACIPSLAGCADILELGASSFHLPTRFTLFLSHLSISSCIASWPLLFLLLPIRTSATRHQIDPVPGISTFIQGTRHPAQ